MENNYVDNRTPEERKNQPEMVLTSATTTCTCKIDEEGNLIIDKVCYWHRLTDGNN